MFLCRIDPDIELRLWEQRHADELFAVVDANRAHLRRWLPWVDAAKEVASTRDFIKTALEQFARNDGFHAGTWLDGRIVGGIGLHAMNLPNRSTSIGYWLAETAQGRGVMTRSCRALVDHLFGELKLNRVEIRCAVGNDRSCAVPRRLGFRQEGILRQAEWLYDHFVDHVVWGMLAEDWRSQNASA